MPASKPVLEINKMENHLVAGCAAGGNTTFTYHVSGDGLPCFSVIREHEACMHYLSRSAIDDLLFQIEQEDSSTGMHYQPGGDGQAELQVIWNDVLVGLDFTFAMWRDSTCFIYRVSLNGKATKALSELLSSPRRPLAPVPAFEQLAPPSFGLHLQP